MVAKFFCLLSPLLLGSQDLPVPPRGYEIDAILTRLEKRGDGVKDIRCKVRFVEDDRINLSKRVKIGSIRFLITDPNPLFLIHFEKTESDGTAGKQEWYLFDGRWFHEAVERVAQVTKRETVREGEKYDPFDIERSPFPLPFGQKKEKIVRNFDVSLAAPTPGDPPNTDHLVCLPKESSPLRKRYEKLEFFIRKDLHLPSRIVITRNKGLELTTVDFPDLAESSLNTGLQKRDFAAPSEWKKFKEVVEELPEKDE